MLWCLTGQWDRDQLLVCALYSIKPRIYSNFTNPISFLLVPDVHYKGPTGAGLVMLCRQQVQGMVDMFLRVLILHM